MLLNKGIERKLTQVGGTVGFDIDVVNALCFLMVFFVCNGLCVICKGVDRHTDAVDVALDGHMENVGTDKVGRQIFNRIGRDQSAVRNDHDIVTDCRNFGQNMAGQNNGMIFRKRADQITDFDDLDRVKTDGRFVEDDDFGFTEHCLCDTDTLLVTL